MMTEHIGKQIAALRKAKGVKQEELASYVGVSAQAVSKWENGGVPDTELLPRIADFFSVSIDSLFDRSITDYSDMKTALCQKIIDLPKEKRMKAIFNYCWDMERALFGNIPEDGPIEEYEKDFAKTAQRYSSVMTDQGFTRMGIANRRQYFLLVPENRDFNDGLLNGIDYPAFFKDFSDKEVFDACVFLHRRTIAKAFTETLLVKELKVTAERAKEIIDILSRYSLIRKTELEMDDEVMTVYTFSPTPSFIALLIFSREMIDPPNIFVYFSGGRTLPFLHGEEEETTKK